MNYLFPGNLRHNHLIGVQDNAENSGRFIMDEFIKNECNTGEIHIFCYDRHYLQLQSELNISGSDIHFHDCFPDEEMSESEDKFGNFVLSLRRKNHLSKKLVLIVDSLSTLILIKNFAVVYRLLSGLIYDRKCIAFKAKIQAMLIIHEDTILNANQTLKQLKHICRTWMVVKPNVVTVSFRETSCAKIFYRIYEYRFEEDDKISMKETKTAYNILKGNDDDNLPTSTFKLTLSDNEKKARDAVKLPYEKSECLDQVPEEGKIFYEPDEFDDWDEEDPDNDLEFT